MFPAEDKRRREEIERRNKLDNLCYTIEKTISENKDKLPEGDVSALNSVIAEARQAIEKQDDSAVQEALTKLEKEAHRIASVMYEKAGPQAGGGVVGPAGVQLAAGAAHHIHKGGLGPRRAVRCGHCCAAPDGRRQWRFPCPGP